MGSLKKNNILCFVIYLAFINIKCKTSNDKSKIDTILKYPKIKTRKKNNNTADNSSISSPIYVKGNKNKISIDPNKKISIQKYVCNNDKGKEKTDKNSKYFKNKIYKLKVTKTKKFTKELEGILKHLFKMNDFSDFVNFLKNLPFYNKETEKRAFNTNDELVKILKNYIIIKYNKNKNLFIVNIKGTRINTISNFLKDMKINLKLKFTDLRKYNLKGKYHKGFTELIMKDNLPFIIANEIARMKKKLNINDNYKIIFVGHSKGAALSILLSMIFVKIQKFEFNINGETIIIKANKNNIRVLASAVPPLLNKKACIEFNSILGTNNLIFKYDSDFIPKINRIRKNKKFYKKYGLQLKPNSRLVKNPHSFRKIVEAFEKSHLNDTELKIKHYSFI